MPDGLDLRDVHRRHEPDPAFRLELRRQIEAVLAGRTVPATAIDLDDEEDLIMLTDTRTETPPTAPRGRPWLLGAAAAVAIAVVAAAVVARSDGDGDDSAVTAGTDVVFMDAFDDEAGRWEGLTDVRIEAGQQVWTISVAGQTEFLRPLAAEERLTDMEVSARVDSVDPDSTVGLYCRKGSQNQDFYYHFRLGPTGATIGVLPPAEATPAEVLATEATFTRPTGPFEMTARCVDAAGVTRLTLLVDDEVVAEATHAAPLPAGFGALEVQAGASGSAPSEVRWDDFRVSAIG